MMMMMMMMIVMIMITMMMVISIGQRNTCTCAAGDARKFQEWLKNFHERALCCVGNHCVYQEEGQW